jgi:hypothetical protein
MEKNFFICPHCREPLMPPSYLTPTVNRSDGNSFHLVLKDTPVFCYTDRKDIPAECYSVGFWVVDDRIDAKVMTISVLQTRPSLRYLSAYLQAGKIANLLAERLVSGQLTCDQFEYDGQELTEARLAYKG